MLFNKKGISITFATIAILIIALITAALIIIFLKVYFFKASTSTETIANATQSSSKIESAYYLIKIGNIKEACNLINCDRTDCRVKENCIIDCKNYQIINCP